MLRNIFLIVVSFATFVATQQGQDNSKISECLEKCLTPMAKSERTFSYIFNNFEKVCDLLEDGAFCARKCSQEDQQKFYQFTTFYRIHCIDYEDELQEHVPCISQAAKDADLICKDKCKNAHKVEKNAAKEVRMKKECRTLECTTICYFDELTESCPDAKNVLLKINVGQVHSMAATIHPVTMDNMEQECRNLHNTDYMRSKFLASTTSMMVDHTPPEMEIQNL